MNGIIVINKPANMTSLDVIACLRRRYKQKKFGHAGTLDPMATGVMVVLAGTATKILPYIQDTDKQYIASIQLGAKYDTDDVFGQIEQEAQIHTDFDFEAVLKTFIGKQHQKVPKASAKKIQGKKMYEYLREGLEVPDVYTDIEIYDVNVIDQRELSFSIDCSSGTYIRSVCRDFGQKTNNLAAMKSLVRTKANGFTIEQAQDLDVQEHVVYPINKLLNLPEIQAPEPDRIRNGQTVQLDCDDDLVLVMDQGENLAIYKRKYEGKNWFSCERGLR